MSKRAKGKPPGSAMQGPTDMRGIKTEKKPLPVLLKDADEPLERGLARTLLRPSINHAGTLTKVLKRDYGERGITEMAEELRDQCDAVIDGKMDRPEELLTAQAHTLDALFNDLSRMAYCNWFTHLDAAERLMKVALRAQSQSRATLETLANIKNPPVIIAKQANIAHGHQQVNNEGDSGTRTREIENEPSKLLGVIHGERLDPGATGAGIGSDPAMAAVGAIDRTKDG